uniref:Small ribosomal subunit protein bS16c n=1 Tax=Bostrychia tenella TaxID=324755 RepID=A0A1Z1M6E8_9FLOR|nr:ribosomal protein S16 [Bostrychia tenella]ARW61345.1 ribosomal protein S16 [Bostrychia tenella]
MLKIRLKRFGRKKKACYRIITIDSRKKRDSKAIEEVGFYNPLNKKNKIDIVMIKNRIKKGAKVTKTVKNLIKNNYR